MLYLPKSGLLLSETAVGMLQGIELHYHGEGGPVLRAVMLDGSMVYGCVSLDAIDLVRGAMEEAHEAIKKHIEEGCMGPSNAILATCIKARAKRA